MGSLSASGVVTYDSTTPQVMRSSGGGGGSNRISVTPSRIIQVDSPPKKDCLTIEDGFSIKCIDVKSEANEKCITIDIDIPNIDIEPDVNKPTGCTAHTGRPTFEIVSINGEAPILNVNIDDDEIVYVWLNDVVEISIKNYDENIIYDTPYTSLDNEFLEEQGSNYIWDNGDGTLIFTATEFYKPLEGIEVEIWIYATEGEECRNISEKWFKIKTMEQSSRPLLSNNFIASSGQLVKIDILNYNKNNDYSSLKSSSGVVSIIDGDINWSLPQTAYNAEVNATLTSIEPLKYESYESIVYGTVYKYSNIHGVNVTVRTSLVKTNGVFDPYAGVTIKFYYATEPDNTIYYESFTVDRHGTITIPNKCSGEDGTAYSQPSWYYSEGWALDAYTGVDQNEIVCTDNVMNELYQNAKTQLDSNWGYSIAPDQWIFDPQICTGTGMYFSVGGTGWSFYLEHKDRIRSIIENVLGN